MEKRHGELAGDPNWTIRSTTEEPIGGRNRILDYGSGRGFDATYMGADEYDPYWFPQEPVGPYDIIFCTYVLNVVGRGERGRILDKIDSLLSAGGVSYVTVRRDISLQDLPVEHDGYKQYYVFDGDMKRAGYQSVYLKKNAYEIYVKSGYGEY